LLRHLISWWQKDIQKILKYRQWRFLSLKKEEKYLPEEVHIVDFFRFEGESDPADNSILYAIETNDGTKGTLIDAFGPYADAGVTKFMKEVEDITKKNRKNDSSAN
jgi:hypothetical protein